MLSILIRAGDQLSVSEVYFKENFSGQYIAGNIALHVQEPDGREAYFDNPANTPLPNSQGHIVITPSGARFQRGNTISSFGVIRAESYQFDPPLQSTPPVPSGDYEARAVYESADGNRSDRAQVFFAIHPTDVPPNLYQVTQVISLGEEISAQFTVPPKTGDIAMQAAQLLSSDTLQFTYTTTGNTGPFEVGLYRS